MIYFIQIFLLQHATATCILRNAPLVTPCTCCRESCQVESVWIADITPPAIIVTIVKKDIIETTLVLSHIGERVKVTRCLLGIAPFTCRLALVNTTRSAAGCWCWCITQNSLCCVSLTVMLCLITNPKPSYSLIYLLISLETISTYCNTAAIPYACLLPCHAIMVTYHSHKLPAVVGVINSTESTYSSPTLAVEFLWCLCFAVGLVVSENSPCVFVSSPFWFTCVWWWINLYHNFLILSFSSIVT